MSKCNDVIYEGWLTKSPPTKRIWRGRWRRRWFVLHPGDLPQQFRLAYYTDRGCRKLKGTIDLDHCDQVDIGFKFEDRKVNFDFMFAIKTQPRTYYLAADSDIELRSWVKCICDVCGLKPTNEDDGGIQIIGEKLQSTVPIEIHTTLQQSNSIESPPVSPISTSPYIPISECITGKSPLLKDNDLNTKVIQDRYESCFASINSQIHSNVMYETATYLNYASPTSYETPRNLLPHNIGKSTIPIPVETSSEKDNSSPLHSPAGSDSVFSDENWINNAGENCTASDSCEELWLTQRLTKINLDSKAVEDLPKIPPRPPKPLHINHDLLASPDYFNISVRQTTRLSKDSITSDDIPQQATNDEMYDFPRSHQLEPDTLQYNIPKRHCYNNAAPTICQDGQIFKYDISPKAGTSNQVFIYDIGDVNDDVPPSPSSQNSSVYYNLPSPLLPEAQLSPPIVNRGLKPKRKLSDTLSVTSNTEPSSPRLAPSINRRLKPSNSGAKDIVQPQTKSNCNLKKIFRTDIDAICKIRAAPSPTPGTWRRSHDSVITDGEQHHYFSSDSYHKLEYLDLDLDIKVQFSNTKPDQPLRSPGANTVYKEVDFMKTEAFNKTRNNLEKERNLKCD